jgi:hypothetical protein
MLKRLLSLLYRLVIIPLSLLLLIINLRLYYTAYTPPQADVVAQLRFIRDALDAGTAAEMQSLFPEGYFFSHALYGLAWANLGVAQTADLSAALTESRWAMNALESPAGQAVFSPTLEPPYGVFYVGWSNLLRGSILKLQLVQARDPADLVRFESDSAALASAFETSPTPFLSAYPGQAWPVDNVVAIASLALHDRLLEPRYTDLIEAWLQSAQARMNTEAQLLPHRVDAETGEQIQGARATSQSLITLFLPAIDPTLAADHYARFRQQFLTNVIGVPGILEYPVGTSGRGDVDSGPLLFGISFSASVVGAASARANNDLTTADAFFDTGEALGLPLEWSESKRYALGLLPIGDAFLAWAKSVPITATTPVIPVINPLWRWPVHLISLLLITILWLPYIRARRRKGSSP